MKSLWDFFKTNASCLKKKLSSVLYRTNYEIKNESLDRLCQYLLSET